MVIVDVGTRLVAAGVAGQHDVEPLRREGLVDFGRRYVERHADNALVGLARELSQPRDVAHEQAPKAPDAGVGPRANAHGTVLVIELQFACETDADAEERLPAWRRAGMLDAELRVGRGFDNGPQDGQVFPPAAGHDAVDRNIPRRGLAILGRQHPEHFVRTAAGKGEEALDAIRRRRHDRQSAGPHVLEEMLPHVPEAAAADDVARRGSVGRHRHGLCQLADSRNEFWENAFARAAIESVLKVDGDHTGTLSAAQRIVHWAFRGVE
ncbi:MAG: hypothetical protein FJY55_00425 [Betaproteobacteria bacterium]|nr:hypothetical protein [Betaproteobacteria bacterium]